MFTEEFFAPFPEELRALLEFEPELLPLKPGSIRSHRQAELKSVVTSPEWMRRQKRNRQLSDSAESGLWLWLGFLDRAHEICQDIPSSEGSYWHGIMHRIEGDFWNAKYWMRRAGRHPIQKEIVGLSEERLFETSGLDRQWLESAFTKNGLDSERLVDLCEAANHSQDDRQLEACRWLTTLEWRTLMLYCLPN